MNNFKGILQEYNAISIDYFDGDCLACSAFFLSHCHTDHMVGLGSNRFNRRLEDGDVNLYCSQITKDMLSVDVAYSHLTPRMIALPVHEPTTISLRNDANYVSEVVVTLLPAGHCLGSVMFLFEGDAGAVLYTGDFRLTRKQLQQMEHLHCEQGKLKPIKNLYLDTTFCRRECLVFPSRSESRDQLFKILDVWLTEIKLAVYVNGNAQFGYEQIFVELKKRYNMKVHVCDLKLPKYRMIPELRDVVIVNPTETRLHACYHRSENGMVHNGNKGVLPCERDLKPADRQDFLFITLSTMWFIMNAEIVGENVQHPCSDRFIRILYSMHSSYKEILDLVRYLRPDNVHPLVLPAGTTVSEIVEQLTACRNVNDLSNSFEKSNSASAEFQQCFGSLRSNLAQSQSVISETELIFDFNTSPTKNNAEVPVHANKYCGSDTESDRSEISEDDTKASDSSLKWTFSMSPNSNSQTSTDDTNASDTEVTHSDDESSHSSVTRSILKRKKNVTNMKSTFNQSSDDDKKPTEKSNDLPTSSGMYQLFQKFLGKLAESPPDRKQTNRSSNHSHSSPDEKRSRQKVKKIMPKKIILTEKGGC